MIVRADRRLSNNSPKSSLLGTYQDYAYCRITQHCECGPRIRESSHRQCCRRMLAVLGTKTLAGSRYHGGQAGAPEDAANLTWQVIHRPWRVPTCANVQAAAPPPGSHGDYETMARRRFQSPKPFKEGRFWWLRVWDTNLEGSRKRHRIKLASADMPVRDVQKMPKRNSGP